MAFRDRTHESVRGVRYVGRHGVYNFMGDDTADSAAQVTELLGTVQLTEYAAVNGYVVIVKRVS